MFTKWNSVEDWIRDNNLTSWRFMYDRTGAQVTEDGGEKQTRSNRVAILSDAFPGGIDEKISLTRKRLMEEKGTTLYGYGKRGKENTGMMYCEVRLVDEFQHPSTQAVSATPDYQTFNKDEFAAQIRKEVMMEIENQRYKDERKAFEAEKKRFEEEKSSAIGLLVHHLSPVLAAMSSQRGAGRVAGVDANAPVHAAPIQAINPSEENDTEMEEIFTDTESNKLFELMARFKAVEPRYLELIENVVEMAESGDNTYNMAKNFLLK